jgi:hypothetical protein
MSDDVIFWLHISVVGEISGSFQIIVFLSADHVPGGVVSMTRVTPPPIITLMVKLVRVGLELLEPNKGNTLGV